MKLYEIEFHIKKIIIEEATSMLIKKPDEQNLQQSKPDVKITRLKKIRSSRWRCSIKNVLWNFDKFTGKQLYQSLFFNKAWNLIKKETLTHFKENIHKIFWGCLLLLVWNAVVNVRWKCYDLTNGYRKLEGMDMLLKKFFLDL